MASASDGSDPHLAAELPAFWAEVRIVYGEVPRFLPDAVVRGVLYEASRTEALLEVPDLARLHIRRDVITVEPLGRDIAGELGPYLRRTPLMVLALLHGGLGVSGAAVAGPDGAVVVTGRTVSGKSAMAAALMKRGLRLMADDVSPMAVGPDGRAEVFPVWPEMILWRDTVEALFGAAPPWLGPADGEIPRRTIARGHWCGRPMPLKRVYVLRPDGLEGGVSEDTAKGFAIVTHGELIPYQPDLAAALVDPAALLRLYGAIDGGRTQTLAFPHYTLAEMVELAERIVGDCGWPSPI
jgi:hypothetical protein